MKNILLIIGLIYSLPFYGQSLVKDEVDDFTGKRVKQTSWKTFCQNSKVSTSFRIAKMGDNLYFDVKIMANNRVFSIDKDALLMFKFENGEITELKNIDYTITTIGGGSISLMGSSTEGLMAHYGFNNEQLSKFKNNVIVKMRIDTNSGYLEGDIKEANYQKIKNAINLIE